MQIGKQMDACPALAEALKTRPSLWKVYDVMPPVHQREYNTWILAAVKPAERQTRIETSLERIHEWGRIKGRKQS